MKLSIIIPTCEVPYGSGRPFHYLWNTIESVLSGGHPDFECLVGADGHSQAIAELVQSFNDKRIRYIAYPHTRHWGNYQRERMVKEEATGDYILYMDHDDAYVEGALASVNEEIETFPGRCFMFKVLLPFGIEGWMTPDKKHEYNLIGHGCVTPRGFMYWNDNEQRIQDRIFVEGVIDKAANLGQPVIWVNKRIAITRPWSPPTFNYFHNPVVEGVLKT